MTTQKAVVVKEIGQPCVLVDDRMIPEPKRGEVQIKVNVAGLNPHDVKCRDWGLLIADQLPAILASDVVGTVTKLGEGVKDYKIADRVLSIGPVTAGSPHAGLQEYAIGFPNNMAKIPDVLSDDEACTLPTNFSTICSAFFLVLGLQAPWIRDTQPIDQLLIVGGGSNCGQIGVQVAKLAGIPKIIVVGGEEKHLKLLGATHVIDRHGTEDEVVKQVRDAVGDDLLYAFDTVNLPDGLGVALRSLSSSKQGKLARLLPLREVDESMARGHQVLDVLGNQYWDNALSAEMFRRLPGYIEAGSIRPTPYSAKHGLEADVVNAALDEYNQGGKILKPQIHI